MLPRRGVGGTDAIMLPSTDKATWLPRRGVGGTDAIMLPPTDKAIWLPRRGVGGTAAIWLPRRDSARGTRSRAPSSLGIGAMLQCARARSAGSAGAVAAGISSPISDRLQIDWDGEHLRQIPDTSSDRRANQAARREAETRRRARILRIVPCFVYELGVPARGDTSGFPSGERAQSHHYLLVISSSQLLSLNLQM